MYSVESARSKELDSLKVYCRHLDLTGEIPMYSFTNLRGRAGTNLLLLVVVVRLRSNGCG